MRLHVSDSPFPHMIADGWWDNELLHAVLAEFPDPDAAGWKSYSNGNERKLEGPPALWGELTRELFEQISKRTPQLEEAFGIRGLHMETIGGGYHCIAPGGFLAIHTDFNRSTITRRHRRLNLLIYLNDEWDDLGGRLQLWNTENLEVEVAPEFNRTVVFETSDHSWHGHPMPASRWRRSVAAYFFTDAPPPGYLGDHSTVWHADAP